MSEDQAIHSHVQDWVRKGDRHPDDIGFKMGSNFAIGSHPPRNPGLLDTGGVAKRRWKVVRGADNRAVIHTYINDQFRIVYTDLDYSHADSIHSIIDSLWR